ncbi:hypothetical protein ZIOFF_071211 [Zingiber officinale]|uniref:Uncharacterized protein n=1 Tax=Zingiber officinale TaxID=94328 RepID=A0A8J5C802_ZINOF|nr:hypothetical protein ZIOFF_071211 [Zingiber officinale]
MLLVAEISPLPLTLLILIRHLLSFDHRSWICRQAPEVALLCTGCLRPRAGGGLVVTSEALPPPWVVVCPNGIVLVEIDLGSDLKLLEEAKCPNLTPTTPFPFLPLAPCRRDLTAAPHSPYSHPPPPLLRSPELDLPPTSRSCPTLHGLPSAKSRRCRPLMCGTVLRDLTSSKPPTISSPWPA